MKNCNITFRAPAMVWSQVLVQLNNTHLHLNIFSLESPSLNTFILSCPSNWFGWLTTIDILKVIKEKMKVSWMCVVGEGWKLRCHFTSLLNASTQFKIWKASRTVVQGHQGLRGRILLLLGSSGPHLEFILETHSQSLHVSSVRVGLWGK